MTEAPEKERREEGSPDACESAVLILAFNRPDCTSRLIQILRTNRVPRLYFAVDGPRESRPTDFADCAAVRALAGSIDWPCKVQTFFSERNQGCRKGVQAAIDWFFSHESEGVILEDDVLPQDGFFRYCDELLARYREDERVCAISGNNLEGVTRRPKDSYRFSRYTLVWGWATWRRAWLRYDHSVPPDGLSSSPGVDLARILPDWRERLAWHERFGSVASGRVDSWAILWLRSQWRDGAYCIVPTVNHTTNIGFAGTATHTGAQPAYVCDSPAVPVSFPLRHPARVSPDDRADDILSRRVYRPGIAAVVLILVRRALGALHLAPPRS
jgi:hypothetical protein